MKIGPLRGRRSRGPHDAGATALQTVGITIVAALVVGAVGLAVTPSAVAAVVTCHVTNVITGGSAVCDAGAMASAPAGPGQDADDGDRRDAEGDTRGSRRDDARGDRPDADDAADKAGGTEGGTATSGGLGAGVPGTTPPSMPSPPAWEPPDAGSGEYASEGAGLGDRATAVAAELAANALAGTWPDASRNLLHFLGNTGDPLEQDVDSMLSSSEKFSTAVSDQRVRVIDNAIAQAEADGAAGPMTYPVNTPWNGVFLDDNDNWYYALNGISYNQTGFVTVTPPTTPGGNWTYRWETQVNIRDRYNWDGTKSTQIGPFTVTDAQLAELHRKGLAQEYTAVGISSPQSHSGEVQP